MIASDRHELQDILAITNPLVLSSYLWVHTTVGCHLGQVLFSQAGQSGTDWVPGKQVNAIRWLVEEKRREKPDIAFGIGWFLF